MRRSMFVLSLLAALSGTPLRLAEAAHDLTCSLAELGSIGDIEAPDDGIGDDSDATIKADTVDISVDLAFADIPTAFLLHTPPASRAELQRREFRPPRFTANLGQRLAILERFLC